jgi:glycosyltransferase involved in cell wall biosynthesis
MIVLSANMNLHTDSDTSPLLNDVRSWAWGTPEVLDELSASAKHQLRSLESGDEIALAYIAGKHVLPTDGRLPLLRAMRWVLRQARAADRTVIAAPPSENRDRLLWLTILVASIVGRRPLTVYSEVWCYPAGPRHALRRAIDRMTTAVAASVLVPSGLHVAFRQIGPAGHKTRKIAAPYARPPSVVAIARPRKEPPTVLYVGRLVRFKGFDRLLDIFDQFLNDALRVRLSVVIGASGEQYMGNNPHYQQECMARLRRFPAESVSVVEAVDDVGPFYREATVVALPNRCVPHEKVPAEAWGRVVVEALNAGVPVVSTDVVPSAVEFVRTGVNGTLVPWEDKAAFERALRRWI